MQKRVVAYKLFKRSCTALTVTSETPMFLRRAIKLCAVGLSSLIPVLILTVSGLLRMTRRMLLSSVSTLPGFIIRAQPSPYMFHHHQVMPINTTDFVLHNLYIDCVYVYVMYIYTLTNMTEIKCAYMIKVPLHTYGRKCAYSSWVQQL